MKKILFVNDELSMGGVTSVLLNLLNALDYSKYEVDLLILDDNNLDINLIPKSVNLIKSTSFFDVCDITISECYRLGIKKFIKKIMFFILIKTGFINHFIKKERQKMNLKEYDTEISFKEGISTIFITNSNVKNKINWIHSDYKVENYSKNYNRRMKKVFKKINTHVAVSNVANKSFREIFEVDNVITIHNIINVDRIEKLMNDEIDFSMGDELNLISVGRLHPQKSYDRLLNVCKRLNDDGYKYKLYIIGDGEQREMLYDLKDKLSLDNIEFLLRKENPFAYVKKADLFVLSSLYEGLPTVVFESLICKVPVISTKVAGIDEQLKEGYGLIVDNNEEALYKGLKELFDNPELIKKYKENLSNYHYDNEKIINEIEEIL